jgi:hypothetical protein
VALVRPTRVVTGPAGLFVIDGLPAIPEVRELFPTVGRWHAHKLRPCPSAAAWRRHQRRREAICDACRAWRASWDAARPEAAQAARHGLTVVSDRQG